jgi:hypothetical protein
MLQNESSVFLEFVANRVSEIRNKLDVEKEWFWIPTDMNLVDYGKRGNVKAAEIGEGSVYQEGLPWMAGPIEEWSVKQKIEPPPTEELRKGTVVIACKVTTAEEPFIKYSSTLARTTRILGYVFLFACRARKKTTDGLQLAKRGGHQIKSTPPPKFLQVAEDFLIQEAQRGLCMQKLESLMPQKSMIQDVLGCTRTLWTVGGRMLNKLKIG